MTRILFVILLLGISVSGLGRDILFPVAKNGKWGLVRQNGEMVLIPVYDYLEYSIRGKKFIYYHSGKMGLISLDGKILSEPVHEQISFLDTNWICYAQSGKWSLYRNAERIIEFTYDSIVRYSDEVFQLIQKDTILLFHPEKNIFSKSWYTTVTNFDGLIFAQKGNAKYDLLNPSDYTVIISDLTGCEITGGSYFIARFTDGQSVYSTETKKPVSDRFENIAHISGNYFIFQKSNAGFLFRADRRQIFTLPDFDGISQINSPYVFFQKGGMTGIWNYQKGLLISEPEYDAVSSAGGSFYVRLNGLYGIVSTDGKEIIPPAYSSIVAYDNLFLVSQSGLYGLIAPSGKKIKDCIYKEVRVYENNVKCFHSKKLDLLNLDDDGSILAETSYTDFMTISFDKEKIPRQRSQNLNFTGDGIEKERSDYESLGWFQKTSERIIKDSVHIIKGNWGLRYNEDSVAIEPRFPDIRVIKQAGLTECYSKKRYDIGLKDDRPDLEAAGAVFIMNSKTYGVSHGFFRLADHISKKMLSRTLFQSIEYADMEKYTLARGLTKTLVLLDKSGSIIYDSLTYYGHYREDILPVCFGGKYTFTKQKNSLSLESTSGFLERIGMKYKSISPSGLYFSVSGGNWFFMDASGKKMNDIPFQFVKPFDQNRSIVMRNGRWGVVDSLMNEIVPIEFQSVEEFFVDGKQFFKVRNSVSNTFIYTRSTGNLAKSDIRHTKYYSEGRWFAQLSNGNYGLVDTLLNPLTDFNFQIVSPFEDGYAMVTNRGKRSVIDHNGNEFLKGYKAKDINYLDYERFEIVQSKGSLVVTIDQDTLIRPEKCKSVIENSEKFIIYKDANKSFQLYSTDPDQHLPKGTKISSYCLENETLLLSKDGKNRIYSLRENRYLTKPVQNIISLGPDCYVYQDSKQKKGLVRLNGDTIIHAIYDEIEIQKNRWAIARVDKRTLIRIDLEGKPLNDQQFTRYLRKSDHFIFYSLSGIGLFDLNGQMILPCEFDLIEKYNSIFYKTKSEETYDLYYLNGEKVIPGNYRDYKGFSTATMVVKSGGLDYLYTGYLNKSLSFQSVDPINSDLFILTETNHQGVYDAAGKNIIPVRYHNITTDRNYFQVRFFNSFGYYTTDGQVVFESY